MSSSDLRYYGRPEYDRILRSIAKKQRWIVSHLRDTEGVNRREASVTLLYQRLKELSQLEA